MPAKHCYVAVDLGAESGRVMLGTLAGDRLDLREVHRFPNGPVPQGDSIRWDVERLFAEVDRGIARAAAQAEGRVECIGVDTWGVDFGLLDADGKLIERPYHYRDARTDGVMERAFERMPRREFYERTGIQFMQINSVFQLLAMRLAGDPALERAERLLFMADLVNWHLCGQALAEYTLASTSQMMDMRTGRWSEPVLSALELPAEILPDVVAPGTGIGELRLELARRLRTRALPVVAVAAHDTASAVAAVPAEGEGWGYLSSGTWSLLGVEVREPVIDDRTFAASFTNEGGVEGTFRLLKNIMGLWLVQECRRQWAAEGMSLSYEALTAMAQAAPAFAAVLDPSDDAFLAPGDMPRRINEYMTAHGRPHFQDKGAMVRAVLEGLALTYRQQVERLEALLGHDLTALHVVGGGSQNDLLNQFTADATGRPVVAGPVEATAVGNVLMQALATGRVESLDEVRALVRQSFPTRRFEPREPDVWRREAERRASASST